MHGIALRHHDPEIDCRLSDMLGTPVDIPPVSAHVMNSGETARVTRATQEQLAAAPRPYKPFFEAIGASSFLNAALCAPLRHIGLLTLVRGNQDEPFAPADEDLLEAAASLIALRVEHGFLADAVEPRKPAADADEILTKREREILGLLAQGHTNREVATQLFLSVRTVEWHRARIQWKLGVQSRAELFQVAARLGLSPAAG
jgi:DNA-binding CsgD family transcriptional regulator